MEDYRLNQTGQEVQDILNGAAMQTELAAETEARQQADELLMSNIEVINGKIPAEASAENPLTDKQYVDDSIASASATFRGTYNEVTDLELTNTATHAQISYALSLAIDTADNNDYCFVQIPTSDATPTEIGSIERYKFVTGTGWEYEYTLNNSGFTAEQWASINSGITSGLVTKLTDLPTNAELNTLLNGKANAADVYTKSETYNKTELDSMITTPDVQYVSVTATAQTTSVTDVLPATGAADTVYRVGSWDGTQYSADSYSEYAWNGSAYVLLNVKNTGIATGSDFDNPTAYQRELLTTVGAVLDGCDAVPTAGSENLVKSGGVFDSVISSGVFDLSAHTGDSYASLSAALTAMNALSTAYKKGGMSIKYVQSSDNKYVQARCMADSFTTDVTQWQGVDSELVAGSKNLVESGVVHNAVNILDAHINKLTDRLYGQESSVIDLTGIEEQNGYIYNGKWRNNGSSSYKIVEVEAGKKIRATGNESHTGTIIFLKSYPDSIVNDVTPADYCDGTYYYAIDKGSFVDIIIPDDCVYMYVRVKASGNNVEVASVEYLAEEGDIPAIEDDIAGIKGDITNIETQVGTLETTVETQIGALGTAVDTLEETVDAIANDTHDVIDLETIERHVGYVYQGAWRTTSSNYEHIVIPVVAGSKATCLGSDTAYANVWVLTEYNPVNNTPVTYADGYVGTVNIPKSTEVTFEFETGCYCVIQTMRSGTDVTPQSVVITKDSVITEKIESNEYIAAINQATIDNKEEIDELKDAVNEVDENFPVNPQILDIDSITVKSWDAKGDDAEIVDGVHGEDFHVAQGDSRITLTETCNINLEEWDAYEFVFRLERPLTSSDNVFIKLRNGNTELLNSNFGTILRDIPYSNQLFRLRKAVKDIPNYDTISHTVDNVQLIFLTSDTTYTITMYSIKFIKTKPCVFISFDGGWTGVIDLALPVMTKYGIKGTAYVEIQYMTGEKTGADHMTAEQVRILDNNGWDVSNHSWHHRNWGPDSSYTDEECEEDMKFSRNWLQQNGFVRGANFYAAPHGVTNVSRTTIFDKYMKYYRAGGGSDYDGFVFPCGSRLTANGRSNIIQYHTFGGSSSAAAALSRINSGINKGKSICINFHNIVADKPEGETYDAEEFPIGEFTTLIQTLATMRDAGTCYVLPNSVVWYGCHGAEVYDNVNAHAEMLGFNGKIISLDANKNLETV